MAKASSTTSRLHNVSDQSLADEIGRVDAIAKAAAAELALLKDEFKARGLNEAVGDAYTVTATETISGRLDTSAVKAFLGDVAREFERISISTVIRIKSAERRMAVAA